MYKNSFDSINNDLQTYRFFTHLIQLNEKNVYSMSNFYMAILAMTVVRNLICTHMFFVK